ncbi:MAG: hypothetical protein ACLQNE_31835 [Thermoguttaceae bacterium]
MRDCGLYSVIHAPDWDNADFRMFVTLYRYTAPVRRFLKAWEDPKNRLALAVVIGDWPAVAENPDLSAYPEIRTKVLALAADCHRRWDVLNAEGFDSRLLIALTNVGSREVPKYLEMAFPMSELAAIGMTALKELLPTDQMAAIQRALAAAPASSPSAVDHD